MLIQFFLLLAQAAVVTNKNNLMRWDYFYLICRRAILVLQDDICATILVKTCSLYIR